LTKLCRLALGVRRKGKAIPLTGRRGLWCCEASRLPHFLDNRLTDGGEVVSLMHRPPFTLQEDSWYSFLLETERIRSTERKKNPINFSGIEHATFRLVVLKFKFKFWFVRLLALRPLLAYCASLG
jgi:hypothetical protein